MPAKLKRLRPGQLECLVLDYMKGHRKEGPLTATSLPRVSAAARPVPSLTAFRAWPKTARSARPNELLAPTSGAVSGRSRPGRPQDLRGGLPRVGSARDPTSG
jgi:hypothetical protein